MTWIPSRPGDSWYEEVWGSAFDDHRCDSGSGPILQVDPRRVLADVEAKRRIVEYAEDANTLDFTVEQDRSIEVRDMVSNPYVGDLILRALAQPYAAHPDFLPAWRISTEAPAS